MASDDWFIELLEEEKDTLDDNTCPLPSRQNDAFEECCELLREDATSLAKGSKQRRSSRLQVRTLLTDVFLGLGPDFSLLCSLAAPDTRLATVGVIRSTG